VTAKESRPGCDGTALKTTTLKVNRRIPHHRHDDPIEQALAAVGFAIECRDVVRRLNELLGGAP
jgi:hypothetical protein